MDPGRNQQVPVPATAAGAAECTRRPQPSACLRALEAACALGRADGHFAVAVDPADEPAATGSWCHGLAPEDLARHVWDAAGPPPASVLLNAPLWYAHGYRDVLASARAGWSTGPPQPRRPGS